jgi:hypothetical protein
MLWPTRNKTMIGTGSVRRILLVRIRQLDISDTSSILPTGPGKPAGEPDFSGFGMWPSDRGSRTSLRGKQYFPP